MDIQKPIMTLETCKNRTRDKCETISDKHLFNAVEGLSRKGELKEFIK